MKSAVLCFVLLMTVPAWAQTDCKNPSSNSDKQVCADDSACTRQNGMPLKVYDVHLAEFYNDSKNSSDFSDVERTQKEWLERRKNCGEGGDLKNQNFRFQLHECLCKAYAERFDRLRFSKRDVKGADAAEMVKFLKMATKTQVARKLAAEYIFCVTENGGSPTECTMADTNGMAYRMSEPNSKKLQGLLEKIGYGTVSGGIGQRGQEILRVNCKASPAHCTWECDQSKGG